MAKFYNADTLLEFVKNNTPTIAGQTTLQCVERAIHEAPTADVVEVKHGEYIYSSTDDKWHCSECFAERPRNNGDIPYSDIYCCYKCGAKMDGKDNNVPTK